MFICIAYYQLTSRKSDHIFLAVKISYRMHNGFNTMSRVRKNNVLTYITKQIYNVIITTSNILHKMNFHTYLASFPRRLQYIKYQVNLASSTYVRIS